MSKKRERGKLRLNRLKTIMLLSVLVSAFLSTSLSFLVVPVTSQSSTFEKFGPRVDSLLFNIAYSLSTEWGMLESGAIDTIDWNLPPDKIREYQTNPYWADKIELGDVTGLWYWELDLNYMPPNGSAGPDWRGKLWPTSDRLFRKAMACLVNKDTFVTEVMGGFAARMDTFLPPLLSGWEAFPNGTKFPFGTPGGIPKYDYNITKAKEYLTAAGYKDIDGDGQREFQNATHTIQLDGTDPRYVKLQIYIRSDDTARLALGDMFVAALDMVGMQGTYEAIRANAGTCWAHAWKYYDYHIYTGGWDVIKTPDYLYDVWHTSMDIYPIEDGNNYMRVHNSTLDFWLEKLKYAPTISDAKNALFEVERIIADDVAGIPVFDDVGFMARRKNYGTFTGEEAYAGKPWLGFVNEKGRGFYGGPGFGFSALNAHPQDFERGGKFRQGMLNDVESFNPIYADMFWDWLVLDHIYDRLLRTDPYDLSTDIPWMVKPGWVEGTWVNATGQTNTKISFKLYDNILWHDGTRFTADDVIFTFKAMFDGLSPLWYPDALNIYNITKNGPYDITFFFKVRSAWALHWAGYTPIIPKHIWEPLSIAERRALEPMSSGKLIGTGPFKFYSVYPPSGAREYIRLDANPTYFRELVRPDFASPPSTPGGKVRPVSDGTVELSDFGMTIGYYGDAKPWLNATWGPITDVNKDYYIDIDDIMETGARYGLTGCQSGYPPGYV